MADSAREQILDALVVVVKGVAGVGDVSRGKIDPLDIRRYPAAFIVPATDPAQHLLNDVLDRLWDVSLFLWIKTQGDQSETQETFIAKVKKVMAADNTLGGRVHDITEGVTHQPFPLTEDMTETGIVIEYTINYRTPRTDPYTLV